VSQTVDVNVLVYASNHDVPEQPRAQALLEHLAGGPGLVVLLWPSIMSYLRIVTSSRILDSPLTYDQAVRNVDSLLDRPHVRAAGELDGFWRTFTEVNATVAPRGNLVPDAHLVALMVQHGVATMWSRDRDLRKFDDIDVRDPFADRYEGGFGP